MIRLGAETVLASSADVPNVDWAKQLEAVRVALGLPASVTSEEVVAVLEDVLSRFAEAQQVDQSQSPTGGIADPAPVSAARAKSLLEPWNAPEPRKLSRKEVDACRARGMTESEYRERLAASVRRNGELAAPAPRGRTDAEIAACVTRGMSAEDYAAAKCAAVRRR